jgi:signal transduction histidine kinase
MKRSLKTRYHTAVVILLGLVLLQTILLLVIIAGARDLPSLVNDLQTTVIVFVLIIFIFAIVFYNLIPIMVRKSYQGVTKLVNEIAHGDYEVDIDTVIIQDQVDTEVRGLLEGLKTMLRSIHGFDQAKETKIYEHDQRIKQLINLLPQGVLIALSNGDVSYYNDSLRRRYPELVDCRNIREMNLKSEFDQQVYQKIMDSLRFGDNLYDHKIPDLDYQRQALLNGSVVRNIRGESTGGVFVLTFTEHARQD